MLLDLPGRHGRRPAHIHFMISATGHPRLTTQINIPGDPYLDDDFAFATRDPLVVTLDRVDDRAVITAAGLDQPVTRVRFDFVLSPAAKGELTAANASRGGAPSK